jgi:DNA excision repair protein ERCC-3
MQVGSGIVEGETGSGKTIIGIGIMCALGMRTLLMSPQTDGSSQWIDEIRKHTNIDELEQKHNTKIVGEYKSNKGIAYPITVSTVQAFLPKKARTWLLSNRNWYGLVLVDEVHSFGGEVYPKVIQSINAFSLLGLTATVERKDRRHHLIFDIVGPIVAKGKAKQMPPTVYFIETGVEAPEWVYKRNFPKHFQWKMVTDHIAKDESRYELIRKYLIQDVDDKRIVACISQRRDIIQKLHLMLSQDGYSVEYVDGNTPRKVRKIVYDKVRAGRVQILFAGKVLNQLVDLPRIDCLHFVTPSSSHTTTKQTYGRARRWLEGKRNPVIRDYVDSGGQLDGAYRNRLALCKKNGWVVKKAEDQEKIGVGLSIWKKRYE